MKFFSDLSLRGKLTTLFTLTAMFTLAIAAFVFYGYELTTINANLRAPHEMTARTLSPLSAVALASNDAASAESTLSHLADNAEVIAASIYDGDGNLFALYRSAQGQNFVFPSSVGQASQGQSRFDEDIFSPIIAEGERIGTFYLHVRPANAIRRIINFTLSAIGIFVLCLLASLVLSARLAQIISRPAVELVGTMKAVSEKQDFSLRAKTVSKDEFGALAVSFNHMIAQVSQREEELQKLRGELEADAATSKVQLRQLSAAVEQSPHTIVITNQEGTVEYANRRFSEVTGYTVDEAIVTDPAIITTGKLPVEERKKLFEALEGGFEWRGEFENQRSDGELYWESAIVAPMRTHEGDIANYVWIKEDITESRNAAEALRESEERYALAAQGANDGLWDWDMRNNTVYFSPRWKSMLGYGEEDIGDQPSEWLERIHPDEAKNVRKLIDEHFKTEGPLFEKEFRISHKEGGYRWVLCRGTAVRDEKGEVYRFAGSQTDITDRKRAEEKLFYEASHDPLTKLPNRALFTERLSAAVARSLRNSGALYAVLFCDLDRFKIINDSLGHLIGDQLLIQVSARLGKCVRAIDMIARLGGDEFAILLEDIESEEAAVHVADRIQEELSKSFSLGDNEVFTSTSIGIALSTQGYDRADDILRDSDSAMYRAKFRGKAQYALFDTGLHDEAIRRLELENDMRRAIDREEFVLFYQPIVSITDDTALSMEALVRWKRPDGTIVSPDEFIHVAEETGLIVPMGWLILREACRQAAHWHGRFLGTCPVSVNVNISSKQFKQPNFVPDLGKLLRDLDVDPGSIKLEITETAIIENARSMAGILAAIRDRDIRICIDDFGTGYSSLSYLHELPIDVVKVDRTFVHTIHENDETRKLVEGIISLCKNLGLKVTAEGVENAEQLEMLRAMNCDNIQGYHIAKPMTSGEVPDFIAANHGRWRLGAGDQP
jgi:diguanylate cyclase (GGDEF)-like protein/PAS domain S-box-containing protein